MNQNLTEIVCILDRSGSMQAMREDAIGGFNAFLEEQKKLPGAAHLTIVLFDHEYMLLHAGVDIQQVTPLDSTTYVPRGQTALLDAVGRTIDDVGARLAQTPETDRPGSVVVAILTDGMENASSDYSRDRVAAMIQHQQEKYSWEFIFLAANMDAVSVAQSLSIGAANAVNFAASGQGVRAAHAAISQRVTRVRGSSTPAQD